MADHWSFVFAAYGLAALAIGVYWRALVRRDRELDALQTRQAARDGRDPSAPVRGA